MWAARILAGQTAVRMRSVRQGGLARGRLEDEFIDKESDLLLPGQIPVLMALRDVSGDRLINAIEEIPDLGRDRPFILVSADIPRGK